MDIVPEVSRKWVKLTRPVFLSGVILTSWLPTSTVVTAGMLPKPLALRAWLPLPLCVTIISSPAGSLSMSKLFSSIWRRYGAFIAWTSKPSLQVMADFISAGVHSFSLLPAWPFFTGGGEGIITGTGSGTSSGTGSRTGSGIGEGTGGGMGVGAGTGTGGGFGGGFG